PSCSASVAHTFSSAKCSQAAPMSTGMPSDWSMAQRPPTRLRASSSATLRPAARSRLAAAIPAAPAPMMAMSTAVMAGQCTCYHSCPMKRLDNLLTNNRRWAAERIRDDPEFFSRLVAQQSPRYLWIGCADSRVPANEIVDLAPGELFVHRNVANLVVHTDLNCLSVIQFAVEVLKVEVIMVTGHYGCGGVAAALNSVSLGLVDNWLRHVQDIRNRHPQQLAAAGGQAVDRLCELNVLEQAQN